MHVYLGMHELYGTETPINELINQLAQYRQSEVVKVLGRINLVIQAKGQGNLDLQAALAKDFFSEEVLKKIQAQAVVLAREGAAAILFHRSQLLSALQLACVVCSDDEGGLSIGEESKEDREDFGLILLGLNDYLVFDKTEQKGERQILGQLVTELLPTYELGNNPLERNELARVSIMLDYLRESDEDIFIKFTESTGLEVQEFQGIVFALWGLFKTGIDEKSPRYFLDKNIVFKNTKLPQKTIDAFFAEKVPSLAELSKNTYEDRKKFPEMAFATLRATPLVSFGDLFACSDIGFLLDIGSTALFWFVHSKLSESMRSTLATKWGKAFERYITEIFLRKYPSSPTLLSPFHPNPQSGSSEISDGIIYDGQRLAFMEYKGGLLSISDKYRGIRRDLLKRLERLVFPKRGNNKKNQIISNLHRLEQGVFDDALRKLGIERTDIKKIFPVVITLDRATQAPFVEGYLRTRFEEERGNLSSVVQPITILSAKGVEAYEAYTGPKSFLDMLEGGVGLPKATKSNTEDSILESIRLNGQVAGVNSALLKRWDEMGTKIREYFFGESAD